MGKSFFISLTIFYHKMTRSISKGKAVGIIYPDFNNVFNIAAK